jgi:hypothetical protein
MNFEIEVTKWWAVLGEHPDPRRVYPGYDGRQLVIEGKATVNEAYYRSEDRRFDGATCRIYLRPTENGEEIPKETATWSQEPSGWWIALDLNLTRSLWEDLWRRTYHLCPKISISVGMDAVEGLAGGAMALAALSSISISN